MKCCSCVKVVPTEKNELKQQEDKLYSQAFSELVGTAHGRTFIRKALHSILSLAAHEVEKIFHKRFPKEGYEVHRVEGETDGPPLLMIHGLGGTPLDFDGLIKNLKDQGVKRTIYVLYLGKNRSRSVEEDASKVEEIMQNILPQENDNVFDVVSHSKGGVVTHLLLKKQSEALKANIKPSFTFERVCTIASPLKGSFFTGFAGLQEYEDMGPESALLEKLTDVRKDYSGSLYYISNEFDAIIPKDSALPQDVPKDHTLHTKECVGHVGVVALKSTAKQIQEWFERKPKLADTEISQAPK